MSLHFNPNNNFLFYNNQVISSYFDFLYLLSFAEKLPNEEDWYVRFAYGTNSLANFRFGKKKQKCMSMFNSILSIKGFTESDRELIDTPIFSVCGNYFKYNDFVADLNRMSSITECKKPDEERNNYQIKFVSYSGCIYYISFYEDFGLRNSVFKCIFDFLSKDTSKSFKI